MRGIVHRRQAGPVVGPAIHVLVVAGLEELDASQFARAVELLEVEELARIDHRLGHHVAQSGGLAQLDDAPAFVQGGRHRHRAHDMLARLERLDAHAPMLRDRGVDVHRIDVLVGEHVLVAGVAPADREGIPDLLELGWITLAERGDLGIGVALVDRDEFGAEAEADDGDAGFGSGHGSPCREVVRGWR